MYFNNLSLPSNLKYTSPTQIVSVPFYPSDNENLWDGVTCKDAHFAATLKNPTDFIALNLTE